MSKAPVVIKISGDYVQNQEQMNALAAVIATLHQTEDCLLIHGGGRAIDAWLARLNITPKFHNGLRVTDDTTLAVVEMVLSGSINKHLVFALLAHGVDALGISGVDRKLIEVQPLKPELGRVGEIVHVKGEILLDLCARRILPVISPISAGPDGSYNVNADHAAGAVSCAVGASRIVFLTNVPGVLDGAQLIPRMTPDQAQALMESETISGGMIPKVNTALETLASGVPQVVITDLDGLLAGTGTTFSHR